MTEIDPDEIERGARATELVGGILLAVLLVIVLIVVFAAVA